MSFGRNKTLSKKQRSSSSPSKPMNENELFQQDDLGNRSSSSPFMSFTPKTNPDLSRRYTQKKPPPTATEFMTEFEQERRHIPPPESPVLDQNDEISEDSIASDDDNQDFSDTARLTLNASTMTGFESNKVGSSSDHLRPILDEERLSYDANNASRVSFQQGRPSSRIYQPAYIDPEEDQRKRKLDKIKDIDPKVYTGAISRAIRRVSRRVVNVHNSSTNIDSPAPQLHHQSQQNASRTDERLSLMNKSKTYDETTEDSDTSSITEDVVPTTSTASNHLGETSNQALPTNTSIPYADKDKKKFIQLSGRSLKIFPPTSPIRLFFARILCWK
jgi:hypothetical protein